MDRIKRIRLAVSSSLCLPQATELSIKSPMSLLTKALSYCENTHPLRIKNGQNLMRLTVSSNLCMKLNKDPDVFADQSVELL